MDLKCLVRKNVRRGDPSKDAINTGMAANWKGDEWKSRKLSEQTTEKG